MESEKDRIAPVWRGDGNIREWKPAASRGSNGSSCWAVYAYTVDIALFFLHYNLVLLCFNLLPIWPLDGGKLLQAFLSSRLSFYHAQKVMWKMSCFFLCTGAALFFYLFPYHLQAWMLFLFFIIVHYTEWKQQPYRFFRFLLEREKKAHPSPHTLPEEEKIISFSESPWDVAKKIRSNRYHQFLMKENGQTVPESYILEAIISEGTGRTPVKEQLSFFKK